MGGSIDVDVRQLHTGQCGWYIFFTKWGPDSAHGYNLRVFCMADESGSYIYNADQSTVIL